MNTQKLRQRILDLAIRGKLVPQAPNDEPASVLLDRIRAEKERLIAEGKIKRPKAKKSTDKSHYQNFTPPFDIPASWQWVRLEDICMSILAGGDKPINFSKGKTETHTIPIFSNGIEKDGLYGYTDIATINEESITISARGTIGFCKKRTEPYVPIIRLLVIIPSKLLSTDYVLLAISSLINAGEGSSIPQLTVPTIKEVYLPIPPYFEQLKITKEFEKIENELEIINREYIQLKAYINRAKSKILDLAMQGKLVPQDLSDEPAADMLRRVNPKAKIITYNPHSWNIPNGWCWVMVSDVFAPMKRKLPEGDNFWYIDIDSVDNKRNVAYPKNICTATAPSRASRFTQKGDVVFSMVRPYLRNIALVPEDDCIASTGFYVFHPLDAILSKYSYILTLSSFFVDGLNSYMKGDNSPSINKDNVESFVIPLPPLNEQKRLVVKIEELYSVLDEIESSLRS